MKTAQNASRAAAAVLVTLLSSAPVSAAERGMLQSCWTPESLAGRPDEKLSRASHDQTPNPAAQAGTTTPSQVMGTVRRVKLPPGRKLVALTFDLCESGGEIAGYDGGVIDYLRAQHVKATLFAGGRWMVHHGERAAQLMADPLFEIGTHSWSHANLHTVTGEVLDREIAGGLAAFTATSKALSTRTCARQATDVSHIPAAPTLFRFPFGTCTPEALATVASEGQLAIQWDVVTGDPDRHITSEQIARAVLAETKPGSIIVAHANGRGQNTAAALPMFVPQLRARGYEFVTVGELLAAGTPEIAPTCYERRPGDNARYDQLARLRKEHQPARALPPAAVAPAPAPKVAPAAPAHEPNGWSSHIQGSQ